MHIVVIHPTNNFLSLSLSRAELYKLLYIGILHFASLEVYRVNENYIFQFNPFKLKTVRGIRSGWFVQITGILHAPLSCECNYPYATYTIASIPLV